MENKLLYRDWACTLTALGTVSAEGAFWSVSQCQEMLGMRRKDTVLLVFH